MLHRRQNIVLSVLFSLIIAWTITVYYLHSLIAVFRTWLTTFDFAIVEEAAYRFSRGDFLFLSTRGDHALADNQKYLQFLFGFLNWLHLPQPLSLVLLHTTLGLLTGLLTFFIFRRRSFSFGLLMAAVVLLHPMLLNMILDFVHSEILTPIFLLAAYLGWRSKRKWIFVLFMILTLLVKEDLAFTVFALAFCYALSDFIFQKENLKSWKSIYLFLMVASIFVFVFDLFVILPIFKEWTCNYLGTPEGIKHMIEHQPTNPWYAYIFESPHPVQEALKNIFRFKNLLYLIATGAFLWLWSFRSVFFLALVPGLLLNMMSWADYQNSIYFHYDHAILAILIIGIAEASQKMNLRQNFWRGLLVLFIFVFAPPFFPKQIRMSLFGVNRLEFRDAIPNDEYRTLMWLQKNLPANENISANYSFTAYLMPPANLIFEFPNPYVRHYFGIYFACEDWKRYEMPDWLILKKGDEIPLAAVPYVTGFAKFSIGEIEIYSKPEKIDHLKNALSNQAHERN